MEEQENPLDKWVIDNPKTFDGKPLTETAG